MHAERFVFEFASMQEEVFDVNVNNGWWGVRFRAIQVTPLIEPTVVIGCLGLVTSEVAEAMEAVRKTPKNEWGNYKTKDSFVRELAGTVLRCMDIAQALELPLAEAIVEELEQNRTRGIRHGGKAA